MDKNLDYLYDRKVDCYICKTSYTTKKVLSRYIRAHKHDTDFCSFYISTKINPLLYYVHVCPSCGYSSTEETSLYFPPMTMEAIQEKISKNWNNKIYCDERSLETAINSYKLAIYCATIKKEKNIALAGLYLRLSWLYRTEEINIAEENRFMSLALEEYLKSYMNSDYSETHLSEVKLLYIIGELSRRVDNHAQATKYFSRVIEKQKVTVEKGIVQMAKDRWSEMREQKLG